jgi:hypothetical protein
MRHIIPISGKDSLTTAIVQTARETHDYEYFFNPTGLELPEVFEWLDMIEKTLNIKIHRVGRPLRDIIKSYNYFLPGQKSRYCTRESKIEPMIEWIGKTDATVYYGIRADENRTGFNNSTSPNITPVYPLVEMNINLNGVYLILNRHNLKPPTFYWQELHEIVTTMLGYDPKHLMPEWMFDSLFSWRSRPNCDRCYNQRLYEWVGLLEHHPDRFWEAESWEHKGGEKTYTWNRTKSLQQIADERNKIKKKRAKNVFNSIKKFEQLNLFDDNNNESLDFLSMTSCGLFCGK